jgi:phosphoesterase RecJ-like protein
MNVRSNISLGDLYSILNASSSWVILTHQKPDGDALGSASALVVHGKERGKRVIWGGPDPLPDTYAFLPFGDEYQVFDNHLPPVEGKTSIIFLDISNIERSVSNIQELQNMCTFINIDHHGDNTLFGDYYYVDETSSSLGEILWSLFLISSTGYSFQSALGLYTAIVTDSGNFSFSSTSPRTHEAAADLIRRGVPPAEMSQKIFYNQPLQSLHLWGRVFERTCLFGNVRKACLSWITLEDFSCLNSDPADTEGLVNELLKVKDVVFAVLLVEEKDRIRISLRSRGEISAQKVAHRFGGGGHKQAAGCQLSLSLEEAKKHIIRVITEDMDG